MIDSVSKNLTGLLLFFFLQCTQRNCHVRIEKGPVQTVAIILEALNFLEYIVLMEITEVLKPVH